MHGLRTVKPCTGTDLSPAQLTLVMEVLDSHHAVKASAAADGRWGEAKEPATVNYSEFCSGARTCLVYM